MQKNTEFGWKERQGKAFQGHKDCLSSPPVLAYPSSRPNAGESILDTDASTDKGIGAALSQIQRDGTERVIAYGSRSLQLRVLNYYTTRLRMLALVEFLDYFRYFLLGKRFTVRTDHHALKWLMSFKEPQRQVAIWLERLQQFDFEIVHRPGRKSISMPTLSRTPRRKLQENNDNHAWPASGKNQQIGAEVSQR